MASTQQIKRRIRSVKNTKQITKAMELVAASKMRKAQEATLRSRAYRNTAKEILSRINQLTPVDAHPLFAQREIKKRLYVMITSDRGLAGAYNANLFKLFTAELQRDLTDGVESKAIILGKQGARFASKLQGLEVVGVYEQFPESPTANDLQPILRTVFSEFGFDPQDPEGKKAKKKQRRSDMPEAMREALADGETEALKELQPPEPVDEVRVIFTDFKSSISQVATAEVLLPAIFEEVESPGDLDDVPLEPSPKAVLETITPKLVEVQLFQDLLESQASEQVSRMMAMKSASDNAGDLIDDLTLAYNGARQSAITQELAEITGGAEAIS